MTNELVVFAKEVENHQVLVTIILAFLGGFGFLMKYGFFRGRKRPALKKIYTEGCLTVQIGGQNLIKKGLKMKDGYGTIGGYETEIFYPHPFADTPCLVVNFPIEKYRTAPWDKREDHSPEYELEQRPNGFKIKVFSLMNRMSVIKWKAKGKLLNKNVENKRSFDKEKAL